MRASSDPTGNRARSRVYEGIMQMRHETASQRSLRDRRLAERIRHEDRSAFEALFREYCEELCDFVLRHVSSRAVAEELVQDIFFDIWNRRDTWEPAGSTRAYLYRAARNKSLNHLKHVRVRMEWEARENLKEREAFVTEGPEEALHCKEISDALKETIENLPERRRLIYLMARHHGLSYAEIAVILNISTKTVENQLGRALKFLRTELSAFLSVTL